MGILSGNQKEEPLNYSEVADMWHFLAAENAAKAGYQTYLNHTGDVDLKKHIETIINSIQNHIEEIETLLKDNGIAIPPAPPARPQADLESIPVGARFNDPEIANMIAANTAAGLITLSSIMGKCTREDVALMCGRFHTEKAAYGLKTLRMQKEKGWLITPPLHTKVPELV